MKKRILSIVLAVLMLVSVLPVTALAADNPTSSVTYQQGGVKIEKSAQWTDENKGEAEITFKISGGSQSSTEYPETDIVLVIDKSESMNNDSDPTRLARAKKAAKSFVGKVFPKLTSKVQIAVVSYDKTATLVSKLTNDSNTLNNKIGKISTNGEGTNIQAGIRLAQQTLTNGEGARPKAKKIMLVLTDGEPTYSYQFNVTGATWSGCYETGGNCYGGSLENYGTLVESDVILGNGYNSYNNLNFKTNVKGTATCEHGNTHDFSGAYYTDGTFSASGWRSDTNHRAGTIWEANQAKAKGTEIYSIGFNIGSSGNAYDTMLSVATDANHFKTASDDDLSAIFDGIADTITKAIINDAELTDPLGNGFTLKEKVGGTTYKQNFTGQLNEQTVTFPIQYETSGKKSSNAPLPTNKEATLTYEDANGTEHTITLPNSPELPNPSKKVSYDDGYNGAYATGEEYADGYYWPTSEVSVAPALTTGPAGYVFGGWYRGDDKVGNFKMPEQDVELVAHWKKTNETKQLTITKSWAEGRKQADSVTIAVKNGNETVQSVTLDAANSWSATVNVPKYSYNDETNTAAEINYTIEETGVNGTDSLNDVVNGVTVGAWTPSYEPATDTGRTVTNTYTAEQTYGVEYKYVSSDPTNHPLPTEISTQHAVTDDTEYYVGDPVTNKGPVVNTEYTMPDNSGTWTLTSWTPESATMAEGGVTFTGTWTFTANSMVTLHYEIVVKDEGAPQPEYSTVTKPDDQTGYSGTDFNVAGSATTTDDTYRWTFHGWYTDDACRNPAGASITLTGNTTLYGYWTSVALVGNYKVTEYYMQADGAYDGGTEAESGTHALGEWTYTPDETKPGGYTLNETESDLTKIITADGTAEFKVYYDLSSGSKVTKVAKVSGNVTDHAEVGDTIDYYITVSNEGGLDLTDLTLTDTFNRADLHFDEGEGYTVTPVEGEEGKWTITIPSLTVAEGSITIRATYKVVDTDSGRTLRNTVVGTGDDTEGGSTVTVGEVTHNNVVIDIEKTVTSKRGTAPREGYVFVAYYVDESENEHELGRTTIYMSESATKDNPKTETGKIRFTLSEEEYAMLPKEKVSEDGEEEVGVPYLYVRELPGEDAFTEYDSTVLKGYVIPAPVAYSILPDEPTYKEVEYIVAPETNLFGSVFAFENIYKKSTSRVDPIKVGPQLNRDDHVAYIMGYPDGTVQPEGQITRAEACTIFFRLLTDSSRDYYFSKTNDYTDVNAGDWFNNAISTLSNAGIVTGYNDGTFRPNQPITRGEMAKIIANFANLKYGGKTFTDLAGHWSKSYVELAAGNGWIAGYPDGSFRPDQKITRAETVTMINRVLDRVPAKESRLLSRSIMLTFPDNNPGDWYYIAIQEASNSHEYQRSVYETTGDEMWTKLIDNVDWTKLEK